MRLSGTRSNAPRHTFAGGLVVVLLASCVRHRPQAPADTVPDDLPHRVTVEVLNSGGNPGAARVGMMLLRHARLDVVSFGNADSAHGGRIRNQVLVRRGDTTGVGRVISALGRAEVVAAPDSTRLVDLTVLLGKEFAPGTAPRP